ncbi:MULTISPECIES: hypothetical protein [Amycolatopsis]|uniref:hypothetical protein n=1 Tax=Amycolatopsis sp. CB00013 TaxID=1703945 RepID=UPI000939C1ED|nr:hypothetical protein [Amycolatopsis sp. CB00013]OKJ97859.1 hypothetical protein AMK34_12960 [Amycolatopsis sp. CB00013]
MNKRRAVLAAAAAPILAMTAAATPAQADAPITIQGNCTYPGLGQELCGRVINHKDSEKWLVVADGWNCGGSGTACGDKVRLYPGDLSTDSYKDADGVYIPNGCTGHLGLRELKGGKWTKISDSIGYYKVKVKC